MILAVVKGNVVSTNKTEKLQGGKLLIVEEWNIETGKASGQPRVALDLMGAGEGELVMCVSGSSARQTEQTEKRPVDMAIIGIIDQAELEGVTRYKKYGAKVEEAPASAVKAPAAVAKTPAPAAKTPAPAAKAPAKVESTALAKTPAKAPAKSAAPAPVQKAPAPAMPERAQAQAVPANVPLSAVVQRAAPKNSVKQPGAAHGTDKSDK